MNDPEDPTVPDAARESGKDPDLDHALNALEGMLQNRRVVPGSRDSAVADSEGPDADPDDLPVLENIVQPGRPLSTVDDDAPPAWQAVSLPQHNDLTARLVNELDVIVESSIDEALAEAKKELMAQLKNHLDIVLPEIVDELLRRCTEQNNQN